MPKLKLNLNSTDKAALNKAADESTFKKYMGKPPVEGVYEAVIKGLHFITVKTEGDNFGHPQFRAVVEIREPKDSPKSEYNGFAFFHKVMLPVNREHEWYGMHASQTRELLTALDRGGEAAWNGFQADSVVIDDKKTPNVTALGSYKHNATTGVPTRILVGMGKPYNGKTSPEIKQFSWDDVDKKAGSDDDVASSAVGDDVVVVASDVEDAPDDTAPAEESDAAAPDVDPGEGEESAGVDDSGDEGEEETIAHTDANDEIAAEAAAEVKPARRSRRRFADA